MEQISDKINEISNENSECQTVWKERNPNTNRMTEEIVFVELFLESEAFRALSTRKRPLSLEEQQEEIRLSS